MVKHKPKKIELDPETIELINAFPDSFLAARVRLYLAQRRLKIALLQAFEESFLHRFMKWLLKL